MITPYTAKDVRTVTGLSQGTFSQWLQRGLAKPSVPGKGRGGRSEWSDRDIIAVVLTQKLGEAGMVLTKAASIVPGMVDFIAELDILDERNDYLPTAINIETGQWCGVEMVKRWDGFWIVFNPAEVILDTLTKLRGLK